MVAPNVTTGLSQKESADFNEIYALYTGAEFEALLEKSALFLRRYPKSPQAAHVENLRGLGYLLTRRPQLAIPVFRRSIERAGENKTFRQYVLYNLAKAQFEAGQVDESQQSLAQIAPETLDRDNRLKFHYLKARVYSKRGLNLEAAREVLTASRLLSDAQIEGMRDTTNLFVSVLDSSLEQISATDVLESLYKEYESSTLADSILFRLGAAEIDAGNRGQGEFRLRTLMTRYPQSRHYAAATELLRDNQAQIPVDHTAVGVLLPMKGKFARFGQRNLQAIELAFGIFNQKDPDSKLSLVIEDSGEEPEQTIRALNRLVTKHHVVAVIGPLLSKGIDQITQRAHELGVPLVSLSRYPGVPSEFVFPAGLTLKLQAYEIARFARERLGLKKFAVAFPADKVGQESSQHFWDAVEAEGGTVVGAEAYNPGETDFRAVVDKLSGLHYPEARQRELDELTKQREELKIKKRNRKTEQYFALKPIIDYEAVFIPEETKTAGQLIPTFAYRDVSGVKFLGTSVWNSADLAQRAGPGAEAAYFVDSFFPESTTPVVRHFIDGFRATYKAEPTSMDAMAYDAARILQSVIPPGSKFSRAEVRDRLKDVQGLTGVTGKISFRDGTFIRDLYVFNFKSGQIVRAD